MGRLRHDSHSTPRHSKHITFTYPSCSADSTDSALHATILHAVDAIIRQDSTDKGAWTYVVIKRVARDTTLSKKDVEKAISDMLDHDVLFISCIEIWDGFFQMVYVMTTTPLEENENEILS